MKTINIKGKHNVDKINKEKNPTRACMQEFVDSMNNTEYTYNEQIKLINQLYLGENFNDKILISRELEKKINSYKSQDIKKGIYDKNSLIKKEEVIEKLVISQLKCVYCSCKIKIIFINVREPTQWTLDRIDNDKCHSKDNTLISCLKCNLDRRVTNIDKFKFTKNLSVKKV